jgi:tetratricopeptide (TPR) repeat protein
MRYWTQRLRADLAMARKQPAVALDLLESILAGGSVPLQYEIDVRERVARAQRMLGDDRAAANTLRKLVTDYAGHSVTYYHLARVLEELGDLEESQIQYERFLQMWADADEGLPELEDTRRRLESLRSRS